jgi:hypothetical protein
MTGPVVAEHLVIVDLSGTDLNRQIVRWLASVTLGRAASRARGRGTVHLLAFAPSGDAGSIRTPPGVERLHVSALVDSAALTALNDRAFAASNEIVVGSGSTLFPEIGGTNLGQLSVLIVQGYVRDYFLLLAAAKSFGSRAAVRHCTVVAGYADIANGLAREARSFATTTHAVYPPEVIRRAAVVAGRLRKRSAPAPAEPTSLPAPAPDVLFVSDSVPMRVMFEAVEKELPALGVGRIVHLDYAPGAKSAVRGNVAVVARAEPAAENCPPPDRKTIADRRRAMNRLSSSPPGALPPELRQLVQMVPMQQFLGGLWETVFEPEAAHLHDVRAILSAMRPKLVVIGNDRWWLGLTFALVARELGIPTLSVQDGMEGNHPGWYWAAADVIETSGSIFAEYLVAHGIAPERVRVLGQPRYDSFIRTAATIDPDEARRLARENLGMDAAALYVLFAAQPGQDKAYTLDMMTSVLAVDGVRLVVRPHPSSDPAPYQALVDSLGTDRVTLQSSRGTTLEILTACDAVVLQHSTVALEAAILGKMVVVTAEFIGVPDHTPLVDLGLAIPAANGEALTRAIARFAHQPPSERAATRSELAPALERLIGPIDGQSAARTGKLIASLL